jgi:exopolysaccharide biosynthesis protein
MGMELDIKMNDWEEMESAVEAGPLLIKEGQVCIDMEIEGWLTLNSKNTQAARMDYLDSRGPKIAVGIDKSGDLTVLTINGRIRESVGATHGDMADILKTQGLEFAMGFDPGGSSTLVVENKILNISPYNSGYERDVYSLPPEPRSITNAVVLSEI